MLRMPRLMLRLKTMTRGGGLLVLAVAALTLPTAASAVHGAKPPKPPTYKVLVVTAGNKTSALNQAGVNAIKQIGQDGGTKADPNAKFNVELAQDANDINNRFTAQKLERYRAVVFLNTGGGHAAQRRAARRVRRRTSTRAAASSASARRSRPSRTWPFFTDVLGTRAVGRTAAAAGARSRSPTASTTRARTCREYWDRTDRFYNFTATSAASRTCSPRSSRIRSARSRRAGARRHRGRHDGRRPSGRLVQGLPGRPLVLHGARQHRRRASPTPTSART